MNSKFAQKKGADDETYVAVGQYFFPFTFQLPDQGPEGNDLPSSFNLTIDKNDKKEKKVGIKWTISFSFDQNFSEKKNILSYSKEINVIFEPKAVSVDLSKLQPQKHLKKAFEILKPDANDSDNDADEQNFIQTNRATATFGKKLD